MKKHIKKLSYTLITLALIVTSLFLFRKNLPNVEILDKASADIPVASSDGASDGSGGGSCGDSDGSCE